MNSIFTARTIGPSEGESEVFAFFFLQARCIYTEGGEKNIPPGTKGGGAGREREGWGRGEEEGEAKCSGEIKIGSQFPDPILSVHFLEFHSAILKPDFDLSVCKVNGLANLQAALSRQIHIEQKFLLQFQRLVLSIGAPLLPSALCCQPISCGVFCLYLLC